MVGSLCLMHRPIPSFRYKPPRPTQTRFKFSLSHVNTSLLGANFLDLYLLWLEAVYMLIPDFHCNNQECENALGYLRTEIGFRCRSVFS